MNYLCSVCRLSQHEISFLLDSSQISDFDDINIIIRNVDRDGNLKSILCFFSIFLRVHRTSRTFSPLINLLT